MQVSMPQFGCSTFQITAMDGTVVVGRGMDYPVNMQSQILCFNREEECTTLAPDNQNGLGWTSKLGFIGINAFGLNCIDDGLNEKGLSFAILTLPETEYQTVTPNEDKIALPVSQLGKWILGNFGTSHEVEKALKTVKIWGDTIPIINQVPKVHVALHDNNQHNLVIEFIKGEAKVHHNPIGVLTNEPTFEKQKERLAFLNQLSNTVAPNSSINGHTIVSFPETGLDGMPGGLSSPHRYLRLATHIRFMTKPQASIDAILATSQILGTVNILSGLVILPFNGQNVNLSTQWTTIKDLTNRMFYYRIPGDALKSIDLTQTSFEPGTVHNPINIAASPTIIPIKI